MKNLQKFPFDAVEIVNSGEICVAGYCVLQKLDKALKSVLRSDLEDVSLALLMMPGQFDAYLLRKATKVNISVLE